MQDKHQQFLKIAQKAALAAGKIHKQNFHKDISARSKSDTVELISHVDMDAENAVIDIIRSRFDDHNILSEETHHAPTRSPYTWIIDPLDGTTNYLFGVSYFSVSIALVREDTPIIGVVYNVAHDEMFWGVTHEGAYLNNAPICVEHPASLDQSLLITGFFYDRGPQMEKNLDVIKDFFHCHVRGLRRFGAAALDLCYVAGGRVSGFWEHQLNPWDFAAGALIVREAGGLVTDQKAAEINWKEPGFIVASGSEIHQGMLEIIQRHFQTISTHS